MFKTITTLIRGRSHDAVDAFSDANAISILRQQLRDAAQGLEGAKRSVAIIMAYCERERKAAQRIATQLEDLELRALDALRQGRDDLATEAASAIAELEAKATTTQNAITAYEVDITRLREQVSLSEKRLRALQRGKQLADATAKSQKLRGTMPDRGLSSLKEAEATLERLQSRQGHAEDTALAMAELSTGSSAEATSARLAAAGCGAPLRSEAADVLSRLRSRLDA